MYLGNGEDALLLNYSGAMVTGVTGHTHNEQNQGVVCGWHKESHRSKLKRYIQPIFIAGYNIIVEGEVCEPKSFVQDFLVREATLQTIVTFRRGVEVEVQSYLTDSGIYSLTVKVRKSFPGLKVSLFAMTPNMTGGTLTYFTMPENTYTAVPGGVDFTWHCDDGKAADCNCALRLSRPGFTPVSGIIEGGEYGDVTDGWEVTGYYSCLDAPAKPLTDYTNLREKHVQAWHDYFATSDVKLPDEDMQYLADLSRYVIRANQFPGGSYPAGPFPYHWGGGICCPFDAQLMNVAMLSNGNFDEAFRHVMYYVNQSEYGHMIAAKLGLKGMALSNWSDVFGNHLGRPLEYDLLKRKPMMIAIIGSAAGYYNEFASEKSPEATALVLDCARFIESGFVRDGKIVNVMAGNESNVEAENDSWMLAVSYAIFRHASLEEPENENWAKLAATMRNELERNRNAQGVLMPFANATYTAGTAAWLQYFIPHLSDADELKASREPLSTHLGLDNDNPSEVYLDWPWNHGLYTKAFSEEKCPGEAFPELLAFARDAASNGAIPEKIRLDGYAIGYWYPTPYAVFLLGLTAAFANIGKDGRLSLLYGFDGTWRNLSVRNLHLPGNIQISLTVKDGAVTGLEVKGKIAGLDINPLYPCNLK